MQSQARSVTKDMTDADTQAQFDAETGRLHNQFNFNDRAVQVCYSAVPAESNTVNDSMLGKSLRMTCACLRYYNNTPRHPSHNAVLPVTAPAVTQPSKYTSQLDVLSWHTQSDPKQTKQFPGRKTTR